MKIFLAIVVALVLLVSAAQAGPSAQQDHSKHGEMEKRGDQGMGFAQDKTTHHFLLRKDGGAIQVTANSSADKTSTDEIHMHLQHIVRAFRSGDFKIPMFVHDQTPPGVVEMTKLKDQIKYRYEPGENGGMVVLTSRNEAIKAIHEFLKFQITEHKTGDALEAR
jgi:opacity protein-like surface antigen